MNSKVPKTSSECVYNFRQRQKALGLKGSYNLSFYTSKEFILQLDDFIGRIKPGKSRSAVIAIAIKHYMETYDAKTNRS